MAGSSDPFAGDYSKDFASLRRKRSSNLLNVIVFLAIVVPAVLVVTSAFNQAGRDSALRQIKQDLNASRFTWANDLLTVQSNYLEWLSDHGTQGEVRAFEMLSRMLLQGAARMASATSASNSEPSFLMRTYISLDFAFLRVAFIALAAWRLWLFAFLVSALYGASRIKVHEGADLLGETGNGRLYYSGIRGALENLSREGLPTKQVVGLACPSFKPAEEARVSELGAILAEYGASNETNLRLVGIILDHENWPLHVAKPREESLLESAFEGADLVTGAHATLRAALQLHELYQSGECNVDALGPFESMIDRCLSLNEHEHQLKMSLHRVLTKEMRKQLASIPVVELATTVLAYQAGKVMAYGYEGERWVHKSAFSQLTARAVLHSVPGFAADFDVYSRENIRRALIYGSRSSVYGPVRFAKDLSSEARVLRQWVEVFMAAPHELESVSDQVELFGTIYEANLNFTDILFPKLSIQSSSQGAETIASQTNLAFIPLPEIVSIFHEAMNERQLDRLRELVTLVSEQQRLYSLSVESETDSVNPDVPNYERIFEPFSAEEVSSLASVHDLDEQVVRDWSALRNVLDSFGWLARRVGDYSVSDNSLIFAIFKALPDDEEKNELGLVGRSGVVALRGTRFQEKWGKNWMSRFRIMKSANMAETKEHYDRQMKGLKDDSPAELDGEGGALEA